jgi:hypothetical protein
LSVVAHPGNFDLRGTIPSFQLGKKLRCSPFALGPRVKCQGLPRSTLRDFMPKPTFVPAGHDRSAERWQPNDFPLLTIDAKTVQSQQSKQSRREVDGYILLPARFLANAVPSTDNVAKAEVTNHRNIQ